MFIYICNDLFNYIIAVIFYDLFLYKNGNNVVLFDSIYNIIIIETLGHLHDSTLSY
jgi:hypothetical protein